MKNLQAEMEALVLKARALLYEAKGVAVVAGAGPVLTALNDVTLLLDDEVLARLR
jgi:hypothetical protein